MLKKETAVPMVNTFESLNLCRHANVALSRTLGLADAYPGKVCLLCRVAYLIYQLRSIQSSFEYVETAACPAPAHVLALEHFNVMILVRVQYLIFQDKVAAKGDRRASVNIPKPTPPHFAAEAQRRLYDRNIIYMIRPELRCD